MEEVKSEKPGEAVSDVEAEEKAVEQKDKEDSKEKKDKKAEDEKE